MTKKSTTQGLTSSVLFCLAVTLIISGCSFTRWSVQGISIPSPQSTIAEQNIYFTLDYDYKASISSRDEFNNTKKQEYIDKISSLIAQKGYKVVYFDRDLNKTPEKYFFIDITRKSSRGAGVAWITGLSMGVIPSVESERALITTEISFYDTAGAMLVSKRTVSADLDEYGGIIFMPFFFLNQTQLDVIPDAIVNNIIHMFSKSMGLD